MRCCMKAPMAAATALKSVATSSWLSAGPLPANHQPRVSTRIVAQLNFAAAMDTKCKHALHRSQVLAHMHHSKRCSLQRSTQSGPPSLTFAGPRPVAC